jgi:hypothetical protein
VLCRIKCGHQKGNGNHEIDGNGPTGEAGGGSKSNIHTFYFFIAKCMQSPPQVHVSCAIILIFQVEQVEALCLDTFGSLYA